MGLSWIGYIWLVAGLALLLAEILTSGFLVATFGVAMILTSVLAFLEMGWREQLIGFAVASVFVLAAVRPIFLRYLYRGDREARTNIDALIGQSGIVRQRVGQMRGGRVQVGGEDWSAVTREAVSIDPGERVEVLRVEGATVVVKRVG